MGLFLNEYEKLRLIGRGSFATVYKVRHADLGYVRALKVSHEEIESKEDKAWKTFLNECRMLLRIGNGAHPNIVRIYQPRLLENRATVEMDYVEGKPLSEYVESKRYIPIDEVERFASQIVGALAYCHSDIYRFMMSAEEDRLTPDPTDGRKFIVTAEKERELIDKYSVIHNDLHSNNIIRRDYDGQYILLDFGLAIQDDHCVKSSSRGDGAIEYTAPEKLERNSVSKQSDVYSLGILLYEMLAGQVPFPCKGDTPESARAKVYMQHLTATPPSVKDLRRAAFEQVHPGEEYRDDIPEGLEEIVMKCLSKKPEERYSDAKELQIGLAECFSAEKVDAEPEPIAPDEPQQPAEEKKSEIDDAIRAEIERRVKEELAKAEKEKAEEKKPQIDDEPVKPQSNSGLRTLVIVVGLICVLILAIQLVRNLNRHSDPDEPAKEEIAIEEPVAVKDEYRVFSDIAKTEMVLVEGGTFTMGATSEQEDDAYSDERPTHQVTLSDYYIGKYEVTQQLWEYVMTYSGRCADGSTMSAYSNDAWLGDSPSKQYGKGDTYPAYYVSYEDIDSVFLLRLNRITGKEYCLPTEAEWEYAARGGKHCREYNYKYSGSDTLSEVAWYGEDWSTGSAHRVGQKTPNKLGLYDMSGNVWEWCADWYDYYSSSEQTNPTGSSFGGTRVGRGGSWGSEAQYCRVSNRGHDRPEYRGNLLGFRLACRQV